MIYYIAKMSDDGNWEYLDNTPTYSDAEMMFDSYCDMYPHAYVDIVSTPE
jgi:hypothetical protein